MMKRTVLSLILAFLIAITGGLLITRFLVNEVNIIFIEWFVNSLLFGCFNSTNAFFMRRENETLVEGSISFLDVEQQINFEELPMATASPYDLMDETSNNSNKGDRAWIFFREEDDSSVSPIWVSGVAKTLATSLAFGVAFALVTCLTIFTVARTRSACLSGYKRLGMFVKTYCDFNLCGYVTFLDEERVDTEENRKEAAIAQWRWSTWLLIGCAAAIFGSSLTTVVLVTSQILRIRSEGLF